MTTKTRPKVAIACQGGGSHTAFTAGVLERLLAQDGDEFDVVALTGTSGGAMCAFLAWYGLRTGDAGKATQLLREFWGEMAARSIPERVANDAFVFATKLRNNGYPVWQLSPSANPLASQGQRWLRAQLEQRVDAASVEALVGAPSAVDGTDRPKLLVSAVDATDGSFSVFTDRPGSAADGGASGNSAGTPDEHADERRARFGAEPKPLTIDAVVASAAVPPVFDAVEIPAADGTVHRYWDGLLSQNPPVRNLLTWPERGWEKPDEIWLVRINPTSHHGPLDTLEDVEDRRNELAGSLSLRQELYFIDQVNEWLRSGAFSEAATERYKVVTVREVALDETRLDTPGPLGTSTKLDRDPGFLDDLRALGDRQAAEFLADRTGDRYVVVE